MAYLILSKNRLVQFIKNWINHLKKNHTEILEFQRIRFIVKGESWKSFESALLEEKQKYQTQTKIEKLKF